MQDTAITKKQRNWLAGRAAIFLLAGLAATGIAIEGLHHHTARRAAQDALHLATVTAAAAFSRGHPVERAYDTAAMRFRAECGALCGTESFPAFARRDSQIFASYTFAVDTKIISVFGKRQFEINVDAAAPISTARSGLDSDNDNL